MSLLAPDVQVLDAARRATASGEGQAKGSCRCTTGGEGRARVGLGRWTRGDRAASWAVHMVHGTSGRTCVEIAGVAWRLRDDGRFGWFGPQNHRAGRFPGLGLKTGGEPGVAGASRRRARGAFVEISSRRRKVPEAACPSVACEESWSHLPLRG